MLGYKLGFSGLLASCAKAGATFRLNCTHHLQSNDDECNAHRNVYNALSYRATNHPTSKSHNITRNKLIYIRKYINNIILHKMASTYELMQFLSVVCF